VKVSCHEIIQDGENAKVSCLKTFLFYSIFPDHQHNSQTFPNSHWLSKSCSCTKS